MNVLYALTPDRGYCEQLLVSAASLRRHSPAIPVQAVLFGPSSPQFRSELAELDVAVTERPPVEDRWRYFVKWLALSETAGRRLLFLDTDTFISRPVELLFQNYADAHFYAREEWGNAREGRNFSPGECDWQTFDRIADAAGSMGKLPIYNTGVMLFNHGFHTEVAAHREWFDEIRSLFDGPKATYSYPHSNRHILDEVVSALVLGRFPSLRAQAMSALDAPYFREIRGRLETMAGIVCHVFSAGYAEFQNELARSCSVDRSVT
jgi:hypothetical protein